MHSGLIFLGPRFRMIARSLPCRSSSYHLLSNETTMDEVEVLASVAFARFILRNRQYCTHASSPRQLLKNVSDVQEAPRIAEENVMLPKLILCHTTFPPAHLTVCRYGDDKRIQNNSRLSEAS